LLSSLIIIYSETTVWHVNCHRWVAVKTFRCHHCTMFLCCYS